MNLMKGILLAGGKGTRLNPATLAVSKQLLPIYDKPMVYYPLSTLMLAEIRDILLITTEFDVFRFKKLLGNGNKWGLNISYAVQNKPNGIAEAFIIGEKFINNENCALILGDNIFYGNELSRDLISAKNFLGASIFSSQVRDPHRYGIIEFNQNQKPVKLIEKPTENVSNHAITGLYFFDKDVVSFAKDLKPSKRGELEITDILKVYLEQNRLNVNKLGRGHAWLDTGTHDSLLEASQFVATLEHRQGLKISCPEEIAYKKSYISSDQLKSIALQYKKSNYGNYLLSLLGDKN
ncbi:glucose-1-phosphate thymidylyltransferase [Prochlorococcus marinus str. MU1416]|nr:glucose-1-phosphate thymidylyltransferase RfbA [Prochlorococcus marinus CUG1416]MBW3051891.1 glucose-1-phosphate thymidylyltransferase [Prochlorococcus marinus str. MU1416]